ncbi:hypothetical protein [Marilutibacter spongiae]|uniref:DUF1801 domain-containing protein n=1 Tax=Marilutibacter spongiae TaxID=2025720 RepID=A0A7W3TPE7_9GAMM|nr:hypothetical protein [Lysobacter spongiae]MBB1062050.1 hypothetical protein [Lysobacter spongiae]
MADLDSTFAGLARIMRARATGMSIRTDAPGNLYIEIPPATPGSKPGFFGAVQTKKSYVSYHLMPVYEDPSLLEGVSEQLRKRMQGKSCFNFKSEDEALFKEIDALTRKCAESAR